MTDVSVAGQQIPGGTNDPQHSYELFQHYEAVETNRVSVAPSLDFF